MGSQCCSQNTCDFASSSDLQELQVFLNRNKVENKYYIKKYTTVEDFISYFQGETDLYWEVNNLTYKAKRKETNYIETIIPQDDLSQYQILYLDNLQTPQSIVFVKNFENETKDLMTFDCPLEGKVSLQDYFLHKIYENNFIDKKYEVRDLQFFGLKISNGEQISKLKLKECIREYQYVYIRKKSEAKVDKNSFFLFQKQYKRKARSLNPHDDELSVIREMSDDGGTQITMSIYSQITKPS